MASTQSFTSHLLSLGDEQSVMEHLVRMLRRRVRCRWVVTYLFDRSRKSFSPARCHGLPPRWEALFRGIPLLSSRHRLIHEVTSRQRVVQIADPERSDLISPFFRKALSSQILLAIPLSVKSRIIGVAIVSRQKRHGTFSCEEISVIRELVDFSSLVTSHIRLFDQSLDMAVEMAKRVDIIIALDDINKAISSTLKPDLIVSTATERIALLFDADLIAIIGTNGSEATVRAIRSETLRLPQRLVPGESPPLGKLLKEAVRSRAIQSTGALAQSRHPRTIEQILATMGISSLIAVPITARGRTAGVLFLADRKPDHFSGMETFALEKIASQLGVALENARLYQEMRELFFSTVASLANAIDAKSAWTKGHSERVMHIAEGIAHAMGLDEEETERIRIAGLLHDIGKIGIIEELLEKPRELDDDDFPPIRLHPEKGVAILEPIRQLEEIIPAIRHHHEWYDGSGYPDRLAGDAIPLAARIIAVADSFDAMIADRPYRKGRSVTDALDELSRCAGTQFDPDIVACFQKRVECLLKKKNPSPLGEGCLCSGM
ncbi:MAG: GAF domain-containing protein [Desulfuromonadia bacterium]